MSVYLGLGSNIGDRRANLKEAVKQLKKVGFRVTAWSSILESPALLPDEADSSWNQPYLNCVLKGETTLSLNKLLVEAKDIEALMGRDFDAPRWSPRIIDIDILFADKQSMATSDLTIPHRGLTHRAFVLSSLLEIRPDLKVHGNTVLTHSQTTKPIPQWMGILNATPDSFSDGGNLQDENKLREKIESWLEAGVHVFDIGAESTRPNGEPITPREEWQRLAPIFKVVNEMRGMGPLRRLISIDTRNAQTAQRALDSGADWLNDVNGLVDPNMIRVAKMSGAPVIAMHSLSVPVDPSEMLNPKEPAIDQVLDWLDERRELWRSAGLNMNKIIFDPGIGFGKTALQNWSLLGDCETLRAQRFLLLIGHSRKSFMDGIRPEKEIAENENRFANRDLETIGISMSLIKQGVDVIRCHDPVSHMRI
ncbi:MAG: dihydropteroate synthase, partial [Methylococcales bacterium]|nr:dihydropteroate synthase [Methylococcales bacterium]